MTFLHYHVSPNSAVYHTDGSVDQQSLHSSSLEFPLGFIISRTDDRACILQSELFAIKLSLELVGTRNHAAVIHIKWDTTVEIFETLQPH